MNYAGGDHGAPGDDGRTTSATSPASKGSGDGIPAGWRRVDDPKGFSLLVPNGWKRQTEGDQVDYTPDNGKHRIRISIDKSPDFENPYLHALDLERVLQKRMNYDRVKLGQATYRDQVRSVLWEFTWTERKDFPVPGTRSTRCTTRTTAPSTRSTCPLRSRAGRGRGSSSTSSSSTGARRGTEGRENLRARPLLAVSP